MTTSGLSKTIFPELDMYIDPKGKTEFEERIHAKHKDLIEKIKKSLEKGSHGLEELQKMHELIKITGILPKLDKTIVQEVYEIFLDKGYIGPFRNLWEDILKIRPQGIEDRVQELYLGVLRTKGIGALDAFSSIESCTGVAPDLPEEACRQYFNELFENGCYKEMSSFKRVSSVKFRMDNGRIQERYAKHLFEDISSRGDDNDMNKHYAYHILGKAKELKKATGVSPALDERKVQELYAKLFQRQALDLIKPVRDFCHVEISEETTSTICSHYIRLKSVHCLTEFKKMTGFRPKLTEEQYEEVHSIFLDSNFFNAYDRLKDFLEEEPSKEIINKVYLRRINEDDITNLIALRLHSNVEFSEEVCKSLANLLNAKLS